MKQALITGGSGFIGKHLAAQLLAAGWAVRVLDIHPCAVGGVEFAPGSILDAAALDKAMAGVDVVFHMAAIAHLWRKDKADFYRVNVDGTRATLIAAKRAGVKRLVATQTEVILRPWNLRTARVLDEDEPTPRLEDMAGPYSRSKYLADQMCGAEDGLDIVSLYPTVPIGPGDDGMTAPTAMLHMFLNNPPPAYLETVLNFVAVEDIARAHILAAEKAERGARYLIAGEDWPLSRLLDFLKAETRRPMPKTQIPYWLARVSAECAEASAKLTGKAPMATIEGVRFAKHAWAMSAERAARDLGWDRGDVATELSSFAKG